ncbi:hypothetical protein ACP275_02G152700 [Erythranthe tilingii]
MLLACSSMVSLYTTMSSRRKMGKYADIELMWSEEVYITASEEMVKEVSEAMDSLKSNLAIYYDIPALLNYLTPPTINDDDDGINNDEDDDATKKFNRAYSD